MMGVGIAGMGAVCVQASRSVHAGALQASASQTSTPAGAPLASPARTLVTKYCVTCHNERLKTANLLLDSADADQIANSADTWEKVAVQLRSRAMPPVNMPRPDNATYNAVATWLETELDRAGAARPNPGRPADLHRLNRTEYANAVRDLLGVEIDPTSMLPPDAQAYGFDTNGDALGVDPALLDRYLTAAAKIARIAIGDPTLRPAFERYTAVKGNSNEQTWLWQTERLGESFSLGSRGGIAARHYFPVDGEYVFKVRLLRTYAGVIRGLNAPVAMEIRVDGVRVARFTIGGPAKPSDDADEMLQVRVPLKAGLRQVLATIAKSEDIKAEGLGPARIPIWNREGDVPSAELSISSLLIGGPYNGRVPDDSPSRRRIFVCLPRAESRANPPVRTRTNLPPPLKLRRGLAVARLSLSPAKADARHGFCRRWRDVRIAGRRRATTSRRCLASISVPVPMAPSTPAFARRSSGCSSALISCSASKPIPTSSRPGRRIVSPMSSWRRACRSFSGAASRTMSCSTWRSADNCGLRASSISKCGGCLPIRERVPRWWTTSLASGCRRATSGC